MNLRRVLANLIVNMTEFRRNKGTMFFVMLFPIILMVLFGFIFSEQGDMVYDLPVQDLDGGEDAASLKFILNMSGIFSVTSVDTDLDPNEYLSDSGHNTILVIPQNYSSDLDQNNTVTLRVIFDPSNTAAMTKVQIIHSIVDGVNKHYANVTDMIDIETTELEGLEEFEYIEFFVPGIIAMSVMTTSLFGTVSINTELKQKGVLRKLATTPLTRAEWLLSNTLYQFIVATLSAMLIILVGLALFGLQPHINAYLFVFIMLNVFAFSGIAMLITHFVKEAESAHAAANGVMFPMMFLSGTFFPFEVMPDFLQAIAKFLPLYYINEGMRASMISLDGDIIIYNLLVTLVVAIVIFVLGVLLTSWKED
ncbi:MAG: ABC transporter permease [Thermoplasmata archaeon]|nr:ABC transporter permease [Thermoplasmata archaeon]